MGYSTIFWSLRKREWPLNISQCKLNFHWFREINHSCCFYFIHNMKYQQTGGSKVKTVTITNLSVVWYSWTPSQTQTHRILWNVPLSWLLFESGCLVSCDALLPSCTSLWYIDSFLLMKRQTARGHRVLCSSHTWQKSLKTLSSDDIKRL